MARPREIRAAAPSPAEAHMRATAVAGHGFRFRLNFCAKVEGNEVEKACGG